MQYVFRARRSFECDSSRQFLGAMFAFRTAPQLGQQRTRTTMRPWLSLRHRW
jgi:hypothetical protein